MHHTICPSLGVLLLFFVVAPLSAQDYHLYVTAESEDEVYQIHFDGKKARIAQTIQVGVKPTEIEGPHGMTVGPEGKYWYLSMAHGTPYGKLVKYTTGTNEIVGETELGIFPASMQISRLNGLLYVVNFNLHGRMVPSSVSVVDPELMFEIKKIETGAMPHGSRISPDGEKQYSVAMMSGELFEINTLEQQVSRKLNLEKREHGAMDHSKMGRSTDKQGMSGMQHSVVKPTWVIPHPNLPRLYVAGNGSDELLEINARTWTITHRLPTGKGPYNVEITPDGEQVVVTYKSDGSTGIWDVRTRKELARVENSRPVSHGVAISPDSKYAFISVEGKNGQPGSVDVIDLDQLQRVAVVEVGKQAGGIAFWKMEPAE